MFADDAKVLSALRSSIDSVHLQEGNAWSRDWKVFLNVFKCALLHFSTTKEDPEVEYKVDMTVINCLSTYKDLGIVVNSTLSWSNHVDQICARAYRLFHVIKLKKRLYITLVRSHLTYGSQLWRPLLLKDIRHLEKVQRRATKFTMFLIINQDWCP